MTRTPCRNCLVKVMCKQECDDFISYRKFLHSKVAPMTITITGIAILIYLIIIIHHYDNNSLIIAKHLRWMWIISITYMFLFCRKIFMNDPVFLCVFAPIMGPCIALWSFIIKRING